MKTNIKSQVWIETAIYTLIGLTLIAVVLSIAIPQVNKYKDRSIIKQTVESLSQLDSKIFEISDTAGNIRIINFNFNKGKFEINGIGNNLTYALENTNVKFSEPGVTLKFGEINYTTLEYGSRYNVFLTLDYSNEFDITFGGIDENKVYYPGSYKLKIENKGFDSSKGKIVIDLEVI